MTEESVSADAVSEAIDIMDQLWEFGGWESTQTHESLGRYLLEETYELLDAIAEKDSETIAEELGDLLLQVLFHSRIAQAEGEFTLDDVASGLVRKLRIRSPHLSNSEFPVQASRAEKIAIQEHAWAQAKATEKSRDSCLDGIAFAQPSLALAEKIVSRATAAGLPDDLVPDALRTTEIDSAAEIHLRSAATTFATHIRTAEASARRAQIPKPLTATAWRTHWPT